MLSRNSHYNMNIVSGSFEINEVQSLKQKQGSSRDAQQKTITLEKQREEGDMQIVPSSQSSKNEFQDAESIEKYNRIYDKLDNLEGEEKQMLEELNCVISIALMNQTEDRKNVYKKYKIKMASLIDDFDS